MKKVVMSLAIPLTLAACGSYELPTEELRQMKPACSGGDMAVCADIAHTVRQQRAEAEYLARTQE